MNLSFNSSWPWRWIIVYVTTVTSGTPWQSFINSWDLQCFFNRHLIYMKYSFWNSSHTDTPPPHFFFLSLVTCAADRQRARDGGQHGKPKCCLSTKVLSVKLTPPLECHRTAWRHGGARFFFFFFMKPVRALLQMSHGEFSTASQSLGRQSRKPYYIWGQAPLKLTATAATAKLAERERARDRERERERERERGMFTISTWQQSKLHTSWSHLLWIVARRKRTMEFAVKIERSVWVLLTTQNNCLVNATLLVNPKWIHKLKLCF